MNNNTVAVELCFIWFATAKVLLWLLVMNLGVAVGAGLYEHRIVLPMWIRTSESGTLWDGQGACQADVGKRFWAFVTTIPLTLLGLANLLSGLLPSSPSRSWWIAAAIAVLVDRVLTFAYFIPAMFGLMRMTNSPEAVARATRWRRLNYLRLVILVAAWLAALNAFSWLYQRQNAEATLRVYLRAEKNHVRNGTGGGAVHEDQCATPK